MSLWVRLQFICILGNRTNNYIQLTILVGGYKKKKKNSAGLKKSPTPLVCRIWWPTCPKLHKWVRKKILSAIQDVIRILLFVYWVWMEKNAVMSSSWVYRTVGISLNFPQAQCVLLFTETGIMSLSAQQQWKNILNISKLQWSALSRSRDWESKTQKCTSFPKGKESHVSDLWISFCIFYCCRLLQKRPGFLFEFGQIFFLNIYWNIGGEFLWNFFALKIQKGIIFKIIIQYHELF